MKYLGFKTEQELLIVRGHPGSGKTKLSNEYELNGYQSFENDAYFTDSNGIYKFDLANHQKAKDVCLQKTKKALDKGFNVVVSNTFTKLSEMEPFISYAKEKGIPVRVIEMELNFENVHSVPEQVVIDKKNQFEPFEGAIRVNNPCYRVVPDEDVEIFQYQSDVSSYDGTEDLPKYHVADTLGKLKKVLNHMNEHILDFQKTAMHEDKLYLLESDKEDYKNLKHVSDLLSDGYVDEALKKVKKLDTYVKEVIPTDLVILLGGNIFDEKQNSSRFNDMSKEEIKESFTNILKAYKENPEKGKELDADFTTKFFVDAEMMLKFEDTRKRRLGY